MEEKKKTTKAKVVEPKRIEPIVTKQIDYRPFFNKMMACLYVIIALLVFMTVALLLNLKGEKTTTNKPSETPSGNTEYDVSSFEEVTIDDMLNKIKSSDIQVVYIGRSTCGFCVQFLPVLKQAQAAFGYKTLYVDISKVDQTGYDKIIKLGDFFKDFGSTPMVALFKDGKLIKGTIGASEYDAFATFLKENGLTAK